MAYYLSFSEECLTSLAHKTRFHLIFGFLACSKRNIILTVTAQSNHFMHSKAINKVFLVETSKNWNTWNKYWKYPKILVAVCVKEADRMTNSEDPDQTAPQGAV